MKAIGVLMVTILVAGCSSPEQAAYQDGLRCFRLAPKLGMIEAVIVADGTVANEDAQASVTLADQYAKTLLVRGGAIGKGRNDVARDMEKANNDGRREMLEFAASKPSNEKANEYIKAIYDDAKECIRDL